jgi:PleD family two-component response regulator
LLGPVTYLYYTVNYLKRRRAGVRLCCDGKRLRLLLAESLEVIFSMGDLTLNGSIRILIVDDHAVVRAGFSSVLRSQAGLEVVGSVQSGEEVLTFLESCPVEVLLLDLHMPGMSGIETSTLLRASSPDFGMPRMLWMM